jgi:hypothetical protein
VKIGRRRWKEIIKIWDKINEMETNKKVYKESMNKKLVL